MAIGPLVMVDADDGLDVPTMCCVGAEVREFDGLVALGALVGANDSWLSRELGALDVGVAVTLTGTFIEGLAVLVGAVELVGTDVDDDGDGLAVVGRSLLIPNVVGLVVPIVIFTGDLVGIVVLTTTLGVGRVVGDGSSVVVAMDVGASVGAVVELLLAVVVGALDAKLDGLLVEPIIVAVGKLVGTPPPSLASVGL